MKNSTPTRALARAPAASSLAAASLASVLAALCVTGCASFSPDGGFGKVADLTQERTGQRPIRPTLPGDRAAADQRVAELLREPLGTESAVEIALLDNRGLQAGFRQVGIAESDLVRAGRLANPSFGFERLAGGGVTEIDRSLMVNVLSLLTMPARQHIEQARFEQAQLGAAYQAVGLAAETRRAWFNAVASRDLATYHAQVKEAADASNELAQRMLRAGNLNKLAQMRQQSFYADATAQLARAEHAALADRERLVRLLGLSGQMQNFRLPERLPELPAALADAGNAEQMAMDQRLDVLMARRASEATASQLGLSRAAGFVNVLELGYANKNQTSAPRENGYRVELQLPLFDFGAARNARAEATYLQSLDRAAEVAVNAQSQVRESYAAYRTAYELARHYRDEVVPLRKRISDENLLRYNGMFIDVFELLADAREQVASVSAYVQALRDFWIAQTNLQTAMTGGPPDASSASLQP